jgi:transcriptional regulator with GAF, ATPase, and Fis domain
MSSVDDTMCMHYVVDRLNGIVTETDLLGFIDEVRHNIEVNEDWRRSNPPSLPEQVSVNPEDFDVSTAVDNIKRDYVERALAKSKNVSSAAKLLGLKNYQTLQNWIDRLEIK